MSAIVDQTFETSSKLTELSRPGPPALDPRYTPPPVRKPQRLSLDALQQRLKDARTKLRAAHHQAAQARQGVAAAKALAERAATELASAQADLRALQLHHAEAEREVERCLREGRAPAMTLNGIDRTTAVARVEATEKAAAKFNAELAEAQRRLGEANASVNAAAARCIAEMIGLATHHLAVIESIAARTRSELTACAALRVNGTDLLRLDPATADYIAAPPAHYSEHPDARVSPETWQRNWRQVYQRLVDGDADAQAPVNNEIVLQ